MLFDHLSKNVASLGPGFVLIEDMENWKTLMENLNGDRPESWTMNSWLLVGFGIGFRTSV